ncbi:hypothetical protein H0H93_016376 [Arthromyces matolae]|nr:hypothetical protein H0H93_016376 [Arthromyces matolae]
MKHTTINFIWDFALSKLYTNALLSTLNARSAWGKLAEGTQPNVLYGDNSEVPRFSTYTTANFRAEIMTGTIELDNASHYAHSRTQDSTIAKELAIPPPIDNDVHKTAQ